jgi:Spy/CpxP family protein refolding chaperone
MSARAALAAGVIAASVGVGACGSAPASGGPTSGAPSSGAVSAATQPLEAPGHPGGVLARMLGASLAEIDLRAEQRTAIESIRTDLRAKMQPVRTVRKQLAGTLADGVAAGAIDHAKLDPQIEALARAMEASKPAIQESMNRLHASLDPQQRRHLVESMKAKASAWREGGPEGGGRAHMRERFRKMADELGLSHEQRGQIRTRARDQMLGADMRKAREGHPGRAQHMRAVGEAFASERFDARTLDVGKNGSDLVRMLSNGVVRFVEVALPVLTPEQRARFAQMVRAREDADSE